MNNIHTHYDTLMVSQNASQEVIRAAFKSLSQKYHPDKNTHPDADRIMQQFNESYAVLSDPIVRSRYDRLLNEYKRKSKEESQYEYARTDTESGRQNKVVIINIPDSISLDSVKEKIRNFVSSKAQPAKPRSKADVYFTNIVIISIVLISMFFIYIYESNLNNAADNVAEYLSEAQTYVQDAASELNEAAEEYNDYEQYPSVSNFSENSSGYNGDLGQVSNISYRTHAPNGELYPSSAGYVAGYPQLNNNGASTLTIDNSQNTESVFGKLYYLDDLQPQAVRHFYIQGGGGLNLRNISAGNYDVRYKDLEGGTIAKSEPMLIEEYEDEYGSKFSEITMTLYKVSNGNMETYSIPESEF